MTAAAMTAARLATAGAPRSMRAGSAPRRCRPPRPAGASSSATAWTRLRWLQACLWPHDAGRRERLARAARQMQALPHRLQQADDCIAALEPWVAALPAGVQPVLLTSWVLYYLNDAELARLRATADRLALDRGLAWLCGDLPQLSARDATVPPPPVLPADEAPSSLTLWTLRHGGGERPLAWSHPHGRWIHWLG
jgi:hypothetical protein